MKICPKCLKTFKCGNKNCWCEKIKISNLNIKIVKSKYNDCLCPSCLKKFK